MRLTPLFLAATLVVGSTSAFAAPISGLYVFGDSLSDVGNIAALSGGAVPALPYATGRASNGPVAVDYLAAALGLAPLAPSRLGGTNYAHVGAATAPVSGANDFDNLGLQQGLPLPPTGILNYQVTTFRALPGLADPAALYFVWGGANDLFLSGTTTTAALAAAYIGEAVQQLYNEGARNFLVPNLPAFSVAAGAFNEGLAFEMSIRATLPGIRLTTFDVGARFPQLLDPSFGFTRGLVPCLSGNVIVPGVNSCQSDDEQDASILWDSSHPTTRVHQLLAADLLEALPADGNPSVPEPTTLTLAAAALVGLVVRRRRAA